MALTNLYPPIVDTYMPAFIVNEDKKGTCKIYFTLSPFNSGDIAQVWVSITDQNTNLSLLKDATGMKSYAFSKVLKERVDEVDKFYIEISSDDLKAKQWALNRAYKVQLRLSNIQINNTPSSIVQNQDSMSEWSKVCLIQPIATPELELKGFYSLENTIISSYNNIIAGRVNFKDNETLESYRIKIYSIKDNNKLVYDTNIIYTDTFAPNEIYHQLSYGLIDGTRYKMNFEYTTKKMYTKTVSYFFMVIDETGERIDATVTAVPNDEMGRIEINIASETESYFGNLIIRRASHKDNFTVWEDIKKIVIYDASKLNVTWYDYTAESGVWYKYCVQKCSSQNVRGLVSVSREPAMLNLEDIFITGADGRTLRIKFNPQINSFTHTLLESSQQTIGGKYPFIKRNGNVGYKQFSISGLISRLMDEGDLFTSQTELYNNQNSLYFDYNTNKNITDYNDIIIEKEFRDKVYDFLHDGKVKLFRSATEGSFLIRLMNVSLNPENALGRMLYSFNGTAYEIDFVSIDNLIKYGIHEVGELADIAIGVYENFGQTEMTGDTSLRTKLQTEENIKNENSILKSDILYFNKIKIQMNSNPNLYTVTINNGKEIYASVSSIPSNKNCLYGYVLQISFQDGDVQNFYVNKSGYFELNAEGLKIADVKLIGSGKYTVDYNFIAQKYEDPTQVPKTFKITPRIGQVYGRFSPTDEIGKLIYNKHYYKDSKNYFQLHSLNVLEIEAEPNTVIYILDSSPNSLKRFIVGDTGFLRIEEEDFIITNFSILGKNLKEKTSSVFKDYEYINAVGLPKDSVAVIKNPKENSVYRVKTLDGVWLPERINTPAAGNPYLEELVKWSQPESGGVGESYYYVIYRQGQWYLFTENEDIVIPSSAIVTYYFELEEGEF